MFLQEDVGSAILRTGAGFMLTPFPNLSPSRDVLAAGGIIGFALVWGGTGAVLWATPDPNSFPPYRGVVPIIMSWFFSPILTAIASASIFATIRFLVLRRKNAFNLAFWVLPPAVAFTTFINIFFVCECLLLAWWAGCLVLLPCTCCGSCQLLGRVLYAAWAGHCCGVECGTHPRLLQDVPSTIH